MIKLRVRAGPRAMADLADWTQITTGFNGRAIHGSYTVRDGLVKVKTPSGERATQVEDVVSNPIWLAAWLLRELAKEGKV